MLQSAANPLATAAGFTAIMPTDRAAKTNDVLGYRVAAVDLDSAADMVLELATVVGRRTALIVTLNPELVVRSREDAELRLAVDSAALTVADGVGVLWAARRSGHRLPGRVAGIDLSGEVLRRAGSELRVFFLGGRPGVAEAAALTARERFGTTVAGTHHGYFAGGEATAEVVAAVRSSGAQLLLCGLGERQELFVYRHASELGSAVAIGVGGTLDVMAGAVARTPGWTRQLNIEWLWRVGFDPKRWHRIPRLLRYCGLVLRDRTR